jgi:hypothetical protein
MTDPATGQRSFVQALKVPFDLKGVLLGALAFLAMELGARALGAERGAWETLRGAWAALTGTGAVERTWSGLLLPDEATLWWLLLLKLAVLAVFGVACCRIAGMRLARDEGVDAAAALGFSLGNVGATLGAYLFMAVSMAIFAAANALGGLVAGIPAVGGFAMFVVYPLVLLSSLVLFLLAFGSLLGLPLVLSGLAVERNGALDAVSRAFSYVFSRPVLFFAYLITVGFVTVLLLACCLRIETLAVETMTRWAPSGESWTETRQALEAAGGAVRGLEFPRFGGVEGMAVVGGWAAWLFGMLFHLLLMGWVVYYGFGGATAAYFALRRDVDGTEDEEIWIEGEDRERFGEPERPAPAPGASPPPSPPADPKP